jgi:hypothetical protein
MLQSNEEEAQVRIFFLLPDKVLSGRSLRARK